MTAPIEPVVGTGVTAIDSETLRQAFTTFDDNDVGSGTLRQCALELHVLLQAMQNGCADQIVQTVLAGIAQRMESAADLAEAYEHERMYLDDPGLRTPASRSLRCALEVWQADERKRAEALNARSTAEQIACAARRRTEID